MRLVVLGDPVEHSLSPAIHTAALAEVGIPGSYRARRVDAAGMSEAVEQIRAGDLDGANVTMPHKGRAAALCDRLSSDAALTGAVNTLVRVGDEVVGHNTDIAGVRNAWRWGGLPGNAPVLILGAGGAAAAALVALSGRDLHVTARRHESATAAVDLTGASAHVVAWGEPVGGAVIVNATPLGMRGEKLPAAYIEAASGLLDMAYGNGPTPAEVTVAGRGLPVAGGPTMLLGQAVESFRLWTGRPAPVGVMRAALRPRRGGTAAE